MDKHSNLVHSTIARRSSLIANAGLAAIVSLLSGAPISGCSSGSGATILYGGASAGTGGSSSTAGSTSSGSQSGGATGTTGSSTGGAAATGSTAGGSDTNGSTTDGSTTDGSPGSSSGDSSSGDNDAEATDSNWGTPVAGGPTGSGAAATVTVDLNTAVGNIGSDFLGFSYEKTHITNDSLNDTNNSLIALYKLIGSPPIRLGADDVDNCNWGGTGPAPAAPSGQPFTHTIVSGMVDELCSFLNATGGKIIYGVNFHSDNVPASAAEAAYVMGKCGSSIIGFEIGNEINRYDDGDWGNIQAEWESFATAVVATPGALLVGPAAGGGDALSLSTPFAQTESAKFGDKLVVLTQHYYAGTANQSSATVSRLQTPDPDSPTSQDGLVGTDSTMNAAATKYKIPQGYRLGECNTFAGHGQMGVSDTLIAGLWVLDLMFVTAENGGSGVNLHGGETGMDGTNPFYYEPIMESGGVVKQVQPDYYGMLLFYLAGTGPMVSTHVNTTAQSFTAYSIKANGFTSVILDNKSADNGVSATVNLGSPVSSASAIYLQGTPQGDLTAVPPTNITVAGAPVSVAGGWNRQPPYMQTTSGSTVTVYVPAASAALVHVLQ